jgi:hypothetical protein
MSVARISGIARNFLIDNLKSQHPPRMPANYPVTCFLLLGIILKTAVSWLTKLKSILIKESTTAKIAETGKRVCLKPPITMSKFSQ